MSRRILFVCMGNICRSPAAEIIFRHQAQDSALAGQLSIDSAGTHDYHPGKKPDARMSQTLQNRGYTISGTARHFKPADFDRFDLILTMDEENYHNVTKQTKQPEHRAKVRRMTEFCSHFSQKEVPDPYYGGSAGFKLVADMLEDASSGLLAFLQDQHPTT